jgi:peptidoglycan biosynthesis protein MviN/MurJ (putative lipid II flippase)
MIAGMAWATVAGGAWAWACFLTAVAAAGLLFHEARGFDPETPTYFITSYSS